MFEALGYIVAVVANTLFTFFNIFNFNHGGGDLGPLFTGWVSIKLKVFGASLMILNVYLWYLLYTAYPFTIILKTG